MRKVSIEAHEDGAHPAGGYAVICLNGVTAISEHSTFNLKPVDIAAGGAGHTGWPHGEHIPAETRVTPAGVELIVGPDLVGNAALLPGTAVQIELPLEAVGGEFLWPSVAPLVRPRRKSVFASRHIGEVLPTVAPAPAAGQTSVHEAAENRDEPPVPAAAERPAAHAQSAPDISVHVPSSHADTGAATAAALEPGDGHGKTGNDGTTNDAGDGDDTAEMPAPPVFYQSARRGRLDSRDGGPSLASGPVRSLAGMIPTTRRGVAVLTLAGLITAQTAGYLLLWPRQPVESATALPRAATEPDVASAPSAPLPTALFDVLQAGPTSPAGRAAEAVTPAKALEFANASLFASGAARDTEEAAFWLKRSLPGAAGDDRLRRVLTQLGTTYAAPTRGAPSFAKAQQTWEIAAALGDPQAMCFIAVLYENGLAGPSDKARAELWQTRARQAGGCGTNKTTAATKP